MRHILWWDRASLRGARMSWLTERSLSLHAANTVKRKRCVTFSCWTQSTQELCEQRWGRAWSCLLALNRYTGFLGIYRLFIHPPIILLLTLPADHPRFIPTMVISLLLWPNCLVGSRRSKVNSPQVLDSHTLDLRSWTFCCFFFETRSYYVLVAGIELAT